MLIRLQFGVCNRAGPRTVRNAISVEKFGLTEEYGAAALIERFAYDDMTPQEFLQAFPYCVPGLGDLVFDRIYGTDSMHRFVFHTPHSFFHVGRERRDSLVREHGRLDRSSAASLSTKCAQDGGDTCWSAFRLLGAACGLVGSRA